MKKDNKENVENGQSEASHYNLQDLTILIFSYVLKRKNDYFARLGVPSGSMKSHWNVLKTEWDGSTKPPIPP